MPENIITGTLYGPQGPRTFRWGDSSMPNLEEAFEGKDNENFIEKNRVMCRYSVPVATSILVADLCLLNTKGGIPTVIRRMKYHYTPWLGGTLAYTATVNIVSGLRGGKSDVYNHFCGGLMVGSIIGKQGKSFLLGMLSGITVGMFGMIYKYTVDCGKLVFPHIWDMPPQHGNAFTHKLDFTTNYFPPRPGYWARSEEEVEKVFKQGQMGDGNCNTRFW